MTHESSPLRVLMVAPRYTPYPQGGIAMHIYQVGQRLARMGVDVTILATDVTGRLATVEESEGMHILRVRAWPTNKDYYFAPDIYRVITQGNWELVHCQGYNNLIPPLTMLSAKRANIPYMLSIHSGGDVTALRKALRGLHRRMLRPLLAQAVKIIAVSTFEKNLFQKELRLPDGQFAIISNGVEHLPDVSLIESAANSTNGTHTSPLIVSIGRLVQYKGHQQLIAAMPEVLEQIPDTRLRIVGVGPYEPVLRKMASKLGVADHVEIKPVPGGDWQGMASLIASASLVTLLSEHEGQGIAVLEALALKRPVLVASTSALQEFAERGLVRAVPFKSTPEKVAAAVVEQLRHPLLPPEIPLPTWDDCAAELFALYQRVVRKPVYVS